MIGHAADTSGRKVFRASWAESPFPPPPEPPLPPPPEPPVPHPVSSTAAHTIGRGVSLDWSKEILILQ
jgi:hypothetical protein